MRATACIFGFLLLAACREQGNDSDQAAGPPGNSAAGRESQPEVSYSGPGRNQLCTRGDRLGFIVYAASGDTNCSLRGSVTRRSDRLVIQPDGDPDCRVEAREEGSALILGPVAPACRYYCGPNADFAGAVFDMMPASRPVTDLAGDRLC